MDILAGILPRVASNWWGLFRDVAPYFALALVLGAIIQTYLKPEHLTRLLGRGFRSVILGSLLGAALPACSCSMVPVAAGLRRAKADFGAVAAFIMVAPIVSPPVVVLTLGMLGWKFALGRVVWGLLGGVLVGTLVNRLVAGGFLRPPQLLPENLSCETGDGAGCGCAETATDGGVPAVLGTSEADSSPRVTLKEAARNFRDIFRDLAFHFFLGLLIASAIQALVPTSVITDYIRGPWAYLMAAVVGIPLYVCTGEDVPLAFALLRKGLGPGPAFSFILGSSGVSVATFTLVQPVLGRRTTFFYTASWIVLSVIGGIVFSRLL